jgi:ribosomal protein L37AE/L43A
MFVSRRAGCQRGEADDDARDNAGVTAYGSPRRPGERETTAIDAQRAQGWSCPHCAVENSCVERGAGDVVECDYCGRAFALSDGCSLEATVI